MKVKQQSNLLKSFIQVYVSRDRRLQPILIHGHEVHFPLSHAPSGIKILCHLNQHITTESLIQKVTSEEISK